MSSFSRVQDQTDSAAPADDAQAKHAFALLRKARGGDRLAYGQIVELFQDRLYNAVLRMVGDREEAAELTQEAFTRGLAAIADFRGEAGPYTWLFRIAMNLSISRLRQVSKRRVFSLDAPVGGSANSDHHPRNQATALVDRLRREAAPNPAEAAEMRERSAQVLAALGRLDAEYRAVLVMRDVEGFDYQQMADVLSLPLGTLKSRLFRARIALRDELKAYMGNVH